MKSLFEIALDSLPASLRNSFARLYEEEKRSEYKVEYEQVLNQLQYEFLKRTRTPVLVEIDDDLFFVERRNMDGLDALYLVCWEVYYTGEFGVRFLRSKDKVKLYFDTWSTACGLTFDVEDAYEEWLEQRRNYVGVIHYDEDEEEEEIEEEEEDEEEEEEIEEEEEEESSSISRAA